MVCEARRHYEFRGQIPGASYLFRPRIEYGVPEFPVPEFPVAARLRQTLRKLPAAKRRSLTLDNGHEFARPLELEKKLELPIYFGHPYHAWERGTNENTNGLLRQYLPKGTDLSQITEEQLRSHVRQINHRPRKCLGFQTAFEVFHLQPSG
ncbi:MAG: IS30 family transposase [Planctomycetes bacterium]|nr:IS30 family transposase [Planctomycetota bacterium]